MDDTKDQQTIVGILQGRVKRRGILDKIDIDRQLIRRLVV